MHQGKTNKFFPKEYRRTNNLRLWQPPICFVFNIMKSDLWQRTWCTIFFLCKSYTTQSHIWTRPIVSIVLQDFGSEELGHIWGSVQNDDFHIWFNFSSCHCITIKYGQSDGTMIEYDLIVELSVVEVIICSNSRKLANKRRSDSPRKQFIIDRTRCFWRNRPGKFTRISTCRPMKDKPGH